jgi:hypothetical protein
MAFSIVYFLTLVLLGVVLRPAHFHQTKAAHYFKWLHWIVMSNLPFNFCEDERTRQYTNLEFISVDTLMRNLKLLTVTVQKKIAELIPEKFGIIFDGWEDGMGHYFIAIYAVFLKDGVIYRILLAIQPPLTVGEFTAAVHQELLNSTLALYGKSCDNLLYLSGDNCNVNKCLANNLELPLVGCASHRLNLATKAFLSPHEQLLKRVHELMTKLKTKKRTSLLELYTTLRPRTRMEVRWAADYLMLERIIELFPSIDQISIGDDDLRPYLLTTTEKRDISSLLGKLENFYNVAKELQREPPPNLAHIRIFFDGLIALHPELRQQLGPSADIVNNPSFESGIVKIILGEPLSMAEMNAVEMFKLPEIEEDIQERAESLSFVESLLREQALKKARRESQYDVELALSIETTSNLVERLFSKVIHVWTSFRMSTSPIHLEAVMYLRENHTLWDVSTVNDMITQEGSD